MTKYKAMLLMSSNPTTRFTHRFFTDDEWVALNRDGFVHDENGTKLYDFWKTRKSAEWEKGWSVHPTSPINPT